MRVMLDGHCLDEQSDTLRDALALASGRAEQLGRLILEVHADGQPLEPEALGTPEAHAGPIDELSLVSAEPNAFGLNILHESAAAIDQALGMQTQAADLMEQGDSAQAFKSLSGALAMWDMVQQAVGQTQGFAPPADAQTAAEVDGHIAKLRDELQAVRKAIESQDWSTLGDTLRFDLAELGQSWSALLRTWADGLPRTSKGD